MPSSKEGPSTYTSECPKQSGVDEIESLFASKRDRSSRDQAAKAAQKKTYTQGRKRKHSKVSSENASVLDRRFAGGSSKTWVDDGLGGKFNAEGFTGRKEDGVKIFKAHVLNKPNFGLSKDCPFDCDCCYI